MIEKAVLGMAVLRLLSGITELTAALLMLKFNQVDKALIINAFLAVVGPLILITTMSIGLLGIADRVSMGKLFWIIAGIALILFGLKK